MLYTSGSIAILAIGAFLAFSTLKHTLWPPQPTFQTVSGDECTVDKFPHIPNVNLTSVSIESEQAEHCKISGVIETEIRFELLLPNDWNGKFAMGGGGGFAGTLAHMAMLYGAVHSGYATVGTDTGHAAHPLDGTWALNNPERVANFGHRAVHLTATTAKVLIEAYYQQPSKQNYFVGCSRGGGQALMEAQRYPGDFDGIIAGAPAYNWTAMAATAMQIARAMFPDPHNLGEAIIGEEDQMLIANSYLEKCDDEDGIVDGILTNPNQCNFKIESLLCEGEGDQDCLSEQQVQAMQVIYQGPRDHLGVLDSGFPLGGEQSEEGMKTWMTGGLNLRNPEPDNEQLNPGGYEIPVIPNSLFGFGNGVMQNMIFNDPDWDYSTYSYDNYREDSSSIAKILNATNPDLSSFRDRGGKLLMYHGWSDRALSANATIKYFDDVMSHDPSARNDVRLYLMPGVDHCFGGKGPTFVNFLTTIDSWITSGDAPEALEASWMRWDFVPYESRLICPHPKQLVYDGQGPTREAASFSCAMP
jgi:feruloyl esterase